MFITYMSACMKVSSVIPRLVRQFSIQTISTFKRSYKVSQYTALAQKSLAVEEITGRSSDWYYSRCN